MVARAGDARGRLTTHHISSMELSESSNYDASDERTPPSVAALRLATLLAQRLDAVVPRPFRVRAEAGMVANYEGEEWDGSTDVAFVLDQEIDQDAVPGEWGSYAWAAATAASSALNSVQDLISEGTKLEWPRLPGGGMAAWGARSDGARIFMWYGPHFDREGGAVISFAPISLDELVAPE